MNDFDERLRSRLRALDAAVPAAATDLHAVHGAPAPRRRRRASVWSRLPVGLVAAGLVVVIAAVALLGASLRQRSGTEPAASATPTPVAVVPSHLVILGSEGLPAEIDGQRVYRVNEQAEWQQLSGSFLLAATPYATTVPCEGSPLTGGNDADHDLIGGGCFSPALSTLMYVAPKSPAMGSVWDWLHHAAVFRVHTHDPEAAECSAFLSDCEAAVVVEAIVWPIVPTEIDGERVYGDFRALEAAVPSGSFLLSGLVSVTSAGSTGVTQGCSTAVEKELVAGCGSSTWFSVGEEGVSPKSHFDAAAGQVVVVRAHFNDALAAQCPEDARTACEQAMVVESVVWSSSPYAPATMAPPVTSQAPR